MTLLIDGGDIVIVTANRDYAKHATTYDLTVDGLHTYYVLAGATPVLVHNSGCPVEIVVIGRRPDTKIAEEWEGCEVLNVSNWTIAKWTIAKNDEWVQKAIEEKKVVYVGSPQVYENLRNEVKGRPTVFAREVRMFTDAGV
ncbi:hypothetical protein ALMP_07200 [Streptomyces sp. A012304]|nr:hypothetical protein ALMP_07200 [Streptomyces sp. A012304]